MRKFALLGLFLIFAGVSSQVQGPWCDYELSSVHLAAAIDAAIASLVSQPGWLLALKEKHGYTHALDVSSCTPDKDKWGYPAAENAKGILRRVLDRGEIRVAGVKWALDGVVDYVTDPSNPTGFWPEYLAAVVNRIGEAYNRDITITRKYYHNSALVVDAVLKAEEVDISEPYYYLSGFHNNEPRIEALGFSCSTAGTASMFFTSKTGSITSMEELNLAISQGDNQIVGFIAKGNYDSVSTVLPQSAKPVYLTNSSEISKGVRQSRLLAGHLSEGEMSEADQEDFHVFSSGVISPRAFLFRKERPLCPGLWEVMRALNQTQRLRLWSSLCSP
mmetsp:Transcript_24728/g.58841  ORF Transcript_24728/g.58841 Transcript_24728/m.58841 type:complete len:332 (+) Transcript_24728:120-1115(+)